MRLLMVLIVVIGVDFWAIQSIAETLDDANILNSIVLQLFARGKYEQAIPIAQRVLAIREKALSPDDPAVATALNNLALLHNNEGHFSAAEPLYKRSLAIREKTLSPEHPDLAQALNNLAELYRNEGRYAAAEPLYKRSLAIREKIPGPNQSDLAAALNALAQLYYYEGRHGEAEPLFKRSLSILENAVGPDHLSVATVLNNLAELYETEGRYTDAAPLLERSLAIREKALGPDSPAVAATLNSVAELYQYSGRYPAAEPLYKQSLAIEEKALGLEHPAVAAVLNNLAELYRNEGRYLDAEPLYKRSLAIREKVLEPSHPDIALALNNLSNLYQNEGRYSEAVLLLGRSLAIREKALGAEHPAVATALNNLAELDRKAGRYVDAELLLKRSISIRERALGPEHPDLAQALNNLAELYRNEGRYSEAEPLYQRSLAIREKVLGPDHSDLAEVLNNLAELYQDEGSYPAAETLFKRSLLIEQKAVGPDHPAVATVLNNLAALALREQDWALAADEWRRATRILERRTVRGAGMTAGLTGKFKSDAQRNDWYFKGFVKAADRIAPQGDKRRIALVSETFETAQWAQSSDAAASLAQMAVRSASNNPDLAAIIRERQDLVDEWQGKDRALIAAISLAPEKRVATGEKDLADRMAEIDSRISSIDARLAKEFPEYGAFANLKPLAITEVQELLRADESLVLFLDTSDGFRPLPEETFLWIVTKTEARWVRSDLGTRALQDRVAGLRCGLDASSWRDASSWPKGTDGDDQSRGVQISRRELCKTLTGIQLGNEEALPFDIGKAYDLYRGLFGNVQDLIKDKKLLIVASGALTQLPFQVLVTQAPDLKLKGEGAYRNAQWLIRSHALTILPAVSSLKALRQLGKPSSANLPYVAFANPLLDGDGAADARARQSCAKSSSFVQLAANGHRGFEPIAAKGAFANVAVIRNAAALPETADEVCAVARDLHADDGAVYLGANATEKALKGLSSSGKLAEYRVIHFSTHGAVAGEADISIEPGLILTPPATPSELDDGYLSASEVSGLKLNADWVILSACNTAAGEAKDADALSGLARAFFYAGARSLLVSHWAVDSESTVNLITGALQRMSSDSRIGRSEATRQSMLEMIDRGAPFQSHPAYWAPFVVVGEGEAPERAN